MTVCAGTHGVSDVFGRTFRPGGGPEYRFYAAWYHLVGLVLLRAAQRPEDARPVVGAVAAGLLAAASARVLSIRAMGRPIRTSAR